MNQMKSVLEDYKVGELKELAKISGVSGYSKLKKGELVEAVAAQLETVDVESLDLPAEVKAACSKTTDMSSESVESVEAIPAINESSAKVGLRQESLLTGTRTITKSRKIYPNEPCPCGSGKKYKKCCGRVS